MLIDSLSQKLLTKKKSISISLLLYICYTIYFLTPTKKNYVSCTGQSGISNVQQSSCREVHGAGCSCVTTVAWCCLQCMKAPGTRVRLSWEALSGELLWSALQLLCFALKLMCSDLELQCSALQLLCSALKLLCSALDSRLELL